MESEMLVKTIMMMTKLKIFSTLVPTTTKYSQRISEGFRKSGWIQSETTRKILVGLFITKALKLFKRWTLILEWQSDTTHLLMLTLKERSSWTLKLMTITLDSSSAIKVIASSMQLHGNEMLKNTGTRNHLSRLLNQEFKSNSSKAQPGQENRWETACGTLEILPTRSSCCGRIRKMSDGRRRPLIVGTWFIVLISASSTWKSSTESVWSSILATFLTQHWKEDVWECTFSRKKWSSGQTWFTNAMVSCWQDDYFRWWRCFCFTENVPVKIYSKLPKHLQKECQIESYMKRVPTAVAFN